MPTFGLLLYISIVSISQNAEEVPSVNIDNTAVASGIEDKESMTRVIEKINSVCEVIAKQGYKQVKKVNIRRGDHEITPLRKANEIWFIAIESENGLPDAISMQYDLNGISFIAIYEKKVGGNSDVSKDKMRSKWKEIGTNIQVVIKKIIDRKS